MKHSEPSVTSFLLSLVLVLTVILSFPFWSGWKLYRAKDPDQLLTLKVTFEKFDSSCYQGRSLIAAIDPAFEDQLSLVDIKIDEEGTHSYSYDYLELPETIYVIPPTLLVPISVQNSEPIVISLDSEESSAFLNGQELFRIISVEHTKIATRVFYIDVTVAPVSDVFPIQSELLLGDVVLEQKNSLENPVFSYSDTDGFKVGKIHFIYNTGAKDDISDIIDDGKLVVKEILHSDDEIKSEITSENQAVNIVVKDIDDVV